MLAFELGSAVLDLSAVEGAIKGMPEGEKATMRAVARAMNTYAAALIALKEPQLSEWTLGFMAKGRTEEKDQEEEEAEEEKEEEKEEEVIKEVRSTEELSEGTLTNILLTS